MAVARPQRRTYGQACPVAHALDLIGERWTLLVIRDLMFGALRFSDIRDGLPGLAPNLLSHRLRWLVDQGIVEQVELPPPAARTVYSLTPRGRELGPVVHELARFGVEEWLDPDRHPPPPRLVRGALLALMAPERLGRASWSAALELPDSRIRVTVSPPDGHPLDRLRVQAPAPGDERSEDVTARTTLGTLLDLRRQSLTVAEARAGGRLDLEGGDRVLTQLALLLGWA